MDSVWELRRRFTPRTATVWVWCSTHCAPLKEQPFLNGGKEPITVPKKEKTMATNPEIIDRLTNALQSALMLAARLGPDLEQAARDAAQLAEATSKAASAADELRPDASKRG